MKPILFEFKGNDTDYINALTALDKFKYNFPEYKIQLVIDDVDKTNYAYKFWMIDKVYNNVLSKVATKQELLDNFDHVCKLTTTIVTTKAKELKRRRILKKEIDMLVKARAKEANVPTSSVSFPEEYATFDADYPPQWHQAMGYYVSICSDMGVNYDVDPGSLIPVVPSKKSLEEIKKILMSSKELRKKISGAFALVDIMPESDDISNLFNTCGLDFNPVYVLPDMKIADRVVLATHPNCDLVIGHAGPATYAAFNSGKSIVEVIDEPVEEGYWKSSRGVKVSVVSTTQDNFDKALETHIRYRIYKDFGIQW
jgi:hypothetical protein